MNKMRLYQNAAHCSVALRRFLNVIPHYWPFIPLLWQDAQVENMYSFREEISSFSSSHSTKINTAVMPLSHPIIAPPPVYTIEQRRMI